MNKKIIYLCDEFRAIKDTIPQLEHPFYSLSKRPQIEEKKYNNNGNYFTVIPSIKGQPTIYDKDIMVFIVSQLMLLRNNGGDINPLSSNDRIRITAKDYFDYTGRTRGGKGYKDLRNAIIRLKGTVYTTNINSGKEQGEVFFSLIDNSSKIVEKIDEKTGSKVVDYFEVFISDWMIEAIKNNNVLTLHDDYFTLKPMYKAIYELGRKHIGDKKEQLLKLDTVHRKIGTNTPKYELRRTFKKLMNEFDEGEFPDFDIFLDKSTDMVKFTRNKPEVLNEDKEFKPQFDLEIFGEVKKLAPDFDNYGLYEEWCIWFKGKIDEGKVRKNTNYEQKFKEFCVKKQRRLNKEKEKQVCLF